MKQVAEKPLVGEESATRVVSGQYLQSSTADF